MQPTIAPTPKTGTRSHSIHAPHPASSRVNRNLYDLFIEEVGALSASTDRVFDSAMALYEWLPQDQYSLRRAVQGSALNAQACAQEINNALRTEHLELPFAAPLPATDLVEAISPSRNASSPEPWGVIGIRVISTLRKLALQLATEADEAGEFAFLLGADAMHKALRHWASKWEEAAAQLQIEKSGFCAAAYMADADLSSPFRRGASVI